MLSKNEQSNRAKQSKSYKLKLSLCSACNKKLLSFFLSLTVNKRCISDFNFAFLYTWATEYFISHYFPLFISSLPGESLSPHSPVLILSVFLPCPFLIHFISIHARQFSWPLLARTKLTIILSSNSLDFIVDTLDLIESHVNFTFIYLDKSFFF